MLHDYEFSRVLMLAVDAWRYGPRDDRQQIDLQRHLDEGLRTAARHSMLDDTTWQLQDAGDGRLALLPNSGSEPALVDSFVRELDTWLARHNHDRLPQSRLRLRIAVHNGPAIPAPLGYGGSAVVHVCRLRDSKPVRAALDAAPDANLVLAVSDLIFQDVIRQRHTSLTTSDFTKIEIEDTAKDFTATAWVRVPGAPAARVEVVAVGLRFLIPPNDFSDFVERVLAPAFSLARIDPPAARSFDSDLPTIRLLDVAPQVILGVWVSHLDRLMKECAPEARLVVGVCDLVDQAQDLASSEIAARVLRGARGGRLVVVVPDRIHKTISETPGRHVCPDAYGQAGTSSWLRVPGHATLPRPADSEPQQPADQNPERSAVEQPSNPGTVTAVGQNALAIGYGKIRNVYMENRHDGVNR